MGTLHKDLCIFMIISRSILLRMRNLSHNICRENQNTQFMFSNIFPKVAPFMRKCGKIWYSQTGHRWQNTAYAALCVLDKYRYRHILRICNTYCFSTATIVTQTRLNFTFIRTLLLLFPVYCSHRLPGIEPWFLGWQFFYLVSYGWTVQCGARGPVSGFTKLLSRYLAGIELGTC
jgi:hypothetical protein